MGANPEEAQKTVKALKDKLPKKVPQYLQADYANFTKKVDDFMTKLDNVLKKGPSQTDRTAYENKKKALATKTNDLNKAKQEVSTARQALNTSNTAQSGAITELNTALQPVIDAFNKLHNTLNGKTGKDEVALDKAISDFRQKAAQQAGNLKPEKALTEDDDTK